MLVIVRTIIFLKVTQRLMLLFHIIVYKIIGGKN